MLKPYYEEDGITIYHGDCRAFFGIPFDVLICDPPYGVDLGSGDQRGGVHDLAKKSYLSYADTIDNFKTIVAPSLRTFISAAKRSALFCGPRIYDLPECNAIGGIYCPAALGSTSWGFNNFLPILYYGKDPVQGQGNGRSIVVYTSVETAGTKEHPCAKPFGWMRWLVNKCALSGETVLDPFMGSGTTLRAAKDLGRRAIGIEIEERYCQIAADRLSQKVFQW
jgi:site-specific DNA-methyltransferase (adenine-specific)